MKNIVLYIAFFIIFTPLQAQEHLYEDAYDVLNEMLEDSTKYSFKKAVFVVENAYQFGTLDTIQINSSLKLLANFTDAMVKTNELKDYKFKDYNKVEKYAALFTLMTDSLKFNIANKIVNWTPFRYNFDDIWGDDDWQNMFVSKLLESKSGNCHSLPYLYKILAEEIGVDAHLALAPNHIYIKHRNLKDGWYNTELTSGYFPNDAWIMASGYVHLDGVRNGMYMKALNDKESIALVLIDLANGYNKQFEYNDGSFVIKCCETALKYFPNLINALLLKLETKKKELEAIAERKNKQINEIFDDPKARGIWQDLTLQVRHIHELGYRQIPKEMYLDWLITLNEEKEKYINKKITTFKKQG